MNWFTFFIAFVYSSKQKVDAKLTDASYFYNEDRPLVMAHRGSTGHFPESSEPGFADAFYSGADFVELDIQVSKDGILVINHDLSLK